MEECIQCGVPTTTRRYVKTLRYKDILLDTGYPLCSNCADKTTVGTRQVRQLERLMEAINRNYDNPKPRRPKPELLEAYETPPPPPEPMKPETREFPGPPVWSYVLMLGILGGVVFAVIMYSVALW